MSNTHIEIAPISMATVANTPMLFEFTVRGTKFEIINNTDSGIYASPVSGATVAESIFIPAQSEFIYDFGRNRAGRSYGYTDTIQIIPEENNPIGVTVICLEH